MVASLRIPLACILCLPLTMHAASYYVDSAHGSDRNAGISAAQPWQTLGKVNHVSFQPGDRILLHRGSHWREQLAPHSSGTNEHPIVIEPYGEGAMPRIEGNGIDQDAVLLENVQGMELRGLEVTNLGSAPMPRRGVHLALRNFGTAHHLVVSGLYIHDVSGTNQKKDNGGIVFRTVGNLKPSRFNGLLIERNVVWKVDRSGIVGDSYHTMRTHWFPSLHVVIRDNYVENAGGDGIVPWATDGALVEHNIARKCNQRSTDYNAGIWQWSTDNTTLRLNEASETKGTHDGEGLDSDYNSRNTHFEYNYTHDNGGGFMLICTPVERDHRLNIGNTGTVVRYNISRNDETRLVNLSGADDVKVEHNAFYVGPGHDVQVLVSDWKGWSRNAEFANNTFYVNGTLRFGHAVGRTDDGRYMIAPGWKPAQNITFVSNRYMGNIVNPPTDATGHIAPTVSAPQIDWNEPGFNPARPQDYSVFIAAHRIWMLRLFQQQFGRVPAGE